MGDEQAPEVGETPYLKLPWLAVAGGLVVLLAGALAVGLVANRSLREQVALATPTPAVALLTPPAATTPPAVAAPTAAPASPTPPPATATPAIAAPTPSPTAVATATPEPAASATPRPTVDPVLADEVSAAYEHYWEVRAKAVYSLDGSQLSEVMAGDHLAAAEQLIEQLRSEHRVILTNVDHHFDVTVASPSTAEIADTYISNSVYLDLETHAQLSEPPADQIGEIYELSRVDGLWKVVQLVRSE